MFEFAKRKNYLGLRWVLLLAVAMLLCFAPITKGSGTVLTAQAAGKTIKLSSTKKTISVGATYTLKIKNTGNKTVKWSVADKKIAKIKKNGTKCVITGLKAGTTTVKAKVGSKTYKCTVKVKKVALNTKKYTLNVGGKYTLKLNYSGSGKVKWTTSNSSVVKISASGKKCTIKGKASGTATVKAKVNGKTYKCKVTVSSPKLYTSSISMHVNEEYIAIILTKFSDSMTVSIRSENSSIVKIDKSAEIYSPGEYCAALIGVSEGTTNLIVKAGGKTYKIKVKVTYTQEYKTYITWRKNLEKKLWKSSMSNLDKITAVGEYITENFLYDYRYSDATCYSKGKGGDCKAFSELIYDVATDLGLKASYNGTTSSMVVGHRNTSVFIGGVEYIVDASTNPYTNENTLIIMKA